MVRMTRGNEVKDQGKTKEKDEIGSTWAKRYCNTPTDNKKTNVQNRYSC
jgi:hypothetical protein